MLHYYIPFERVGKRGYIHLFHFRIRLLVLSENEFEVQCRQKLFSKNDNCDFCVGSAYKFNWGVNISPMLHYYIPFERIGKRGYIHSFHFRIRLLVLSENEFEVQCRQIFFSKNDECDFCVESWLTVLVSVSMPLSQTCCKYSRLLAALMLLVIFIHTSSGQKIK